MREKKMGRSAMSVVMILAAFLAAGFAQDVGVKPAEPEKAALRAPEGFRPAPRAGAEHYTNTGWAKEIVHERTGIQMVFVPAGEFMMGKKPVHKVRITKPFYMGKYEVTQEQWQAVMGSNPSHFKGAKNPVERVSWNDCQEFVEKAGSGFRLPTEAEWEYACRAGTTTRFSFGDSFGDLHKHGNYCDRSSDAPFRDRNRSDGHAWTAPVGRYPPNAWGLHDMHGNVYEWCEDWYGPYSGGTETDPSGPGSGSYRVVRGGSWRSGRLNCGSADRSWGDPGLRSGQWGFRLVRTIQ